MDILSVSLECINGQYILVFVVREEFKKDIFDLFGDTIVLHSSLYTKDNIIKITFNGNQTTIIDLNESSQRVIDDAIALNAQYWSVGHKEGNSAAFFLPPHLLSIE